MVNNLLPQLPLSREQIEARYQMTAITWPEYQQLLAAHTYKDALEAQRELLVELAHEVEGYVADYYAGTQDKYPGQKRRYDRDMELVRRVHALSPEPAK